MKNNPARGANRQPAGNRPAGGWANFRYKLMAPYVVAFLLAAIVGARLIPNLFAESTLQGTVTVKASKRVYRTGEVVAFTITNNTSGIITVPNNCPGEPLEVYRQNSDGTWSRLHDQVPYDSKCASEPRQYAIRPDGGTISSTYRYWDHLFNQAGHYRLVVPLQEVQDRPQTEFDVVGSPQ